MSDKRKTSVGVIEPNSTEKFGNFYSGIEIPDRNMVYVFRTTEEGHHRRNSAGVAMHCFGARYGHAKGIHGNSYAIPFDDDEGELLCMETVQGTIRSFVTYTRANTDKVFFVPDLKLNYSKPWMNEAIIASFHGVAWTWLPESFEPYLGRKWKLNRAGSALITR